MIHAELTRLCHRSLDLLCSRPGVVLQLVDACLAQTSHQQFVNIIQQDAALAARVLHAAASSNVQPLPAAMPLSTAVELLSTGSLAALALQAAHCSLNTEEAAGSSTFLRSLWFSSRAAGIAARCLAEAISCPRVEEAQLAGMLHNIGMQLLFAHDPVNYPTRIGTGVSSETACRTERQAYGCDHLQLAAALTDGWRIDSFLPDALRSMHRTRVEGGGMLLRLVQLTHAICVSPASLSEAALSLAQQHFGLNAAAMHDIFNWVERHYRSFSDYGGDPKLLGDAEREAVVRLKERARLLAQRQVLVARLADCAAPEQLLCEGRALLLQRAEGCGLIFLRSDGARGVLCGVALPGQPARTVELELPLDAELSLAGRCLLEGAVSGVVDSAAGTGSVADNLMQRLVGGEKLLCLPLADGVPLGVVAIGLAAEQDLSAAVRDELGFLCRIIGREMRKFPDASRPDSGAGVLRRVAHEVGNPLAILANYLQVLRQQQADGELLAAMEHEVERIAAILAYFGRERDARRHSPELVDMADLAAELLKSLEGPLLRKRQVETRLDIEPMPPVASNPFVLRQILLNLVKNAAEALEAGGTITLRGRRLFDSDGARRVEILVSDDGPGISAAVLERLFMPGVSTKGGHAGLGLSIVRSMAADIGASVSCQSSASGTSFRILLNCQVQNSPDSVVKRRAHE